jgi:hypothetical protein
MAGTGGGLSALSPGHVDQANQKVASLATRLANQHAIIYQARSRGFAAGDVEAAAATHAMLLDQLQVLGDAVSSLDDAGFQTWLEQVRNLEAHVGGLEVQTEQLITQGTPKRSWRIVGATVGSLAVVSLLAWGIWYATQGRR